MTLRRRLLRVAADLPEGDETRRKLLAALNKTAIVHSVPVTWPVELSVRHQDVAVQDNLVLISGTLTIGNRASVRFKDVPLRKQRDRYIPVKIKGQFKDRMINNAFNKVVMDKGLTHRLDELVDYASTPWD